MSVGDFPIKMKNKNVSTGIKLKISSRVFDFSKYLRSCYDRLAGHNGKRETFEGLKKTMHIYCDNSKITQNMRGCARGKDPEESFRTAVLESVAKAP